MKAYLLRNEIVVRLLSLVLVIVSIFINESQAELKILILSLGVLGLIFISYAKGQKTLLLIFAILLIITVLSYILLIRDNI